MLVFHALVPGGQVVATLLPQTCPLSIPFKLKIRVRLVMVIEFCFGWQCVTRKSAQPLISKGGQIERTVDCTAMYPNSGPWPLSLIMAHVR